MILSPKILVYEKEDMGAVPMSSPFSAEAKGCTFERFDRLREFEFAWWHLTTSKGG